MSKNGLSKPGNIFHKHSDWTSTRRNYFQGGPYNPSQLSYPGGGAPFYGGQPPVDPEIQQWFNAVDQDRSGRISAVELQSALVNGQGKNFNLQVCQLMVGTYSNQLLI